MLEINKEEVKDKTIDLVNELIELHGKNKDDNYKLGITNVRESVNNKVLVYEIGDCSVPLEKAGRIRIIVEFLPEGDNFQEFFKKLIKYVNG